MNPLSDELKYYEFQLDSLDTAQSGSASVSSTDWPVFKIGGKKPLQNISAVKILEVQIPFTWYVVTAPYNTFGLLENGYSQTTVTLTPGNYTSGEMVILLGKALTAASSAGSTYTAVDDSNTQKITYWNNESTSKPFAIIMPDKAGSGVDNPRLILGFNPGLNDGSGFDPGAGTNFGNYLFSPNAYSLTGPNYLYVNSNTLGPMVDIYLPQGAVDLGGGNAGPQVAKIPVTVLPGGTIFWSDPDPNLWFSLENLSSLTQVDFYLTLGNQGGVLSLNGQPFSLKMGVVETDLERVGLSKGAPGEHVVKRMRNI